MIMDLPTGIDGVKIALKNGAFIENGVLKLRSTSSFKGTVYQLTYLINGGKHQCKYCKKKINYQKVTLDHKYPQDMGGPTITNNLLPSCSNCNSEKTNMTVSEYKEFKKAKKAGKEREKKYRKYMMEKKNKKRKNKKYQIPKKWLSEVETSKIFLEVKLEESTKTSKYKNVEMYYVQNGYFQRPIIVDKNGFLLDGFYTVLFAKLYGISSLPTIQLENVEFVF